MKKIGFFVDKLDSSELAFLILNQVNKNADVKIDATIFTTSPSLPMVLPQCAVMGAVELYDYDGVAVATSLETAQILSNMIGPKKKVFYIWDLEWMRIPQKSYEALAPIYQDPQFIIAARSNEHAKVIENAWNIKVNIINPNVEIGGFINV
jgi:hypothetical protein